MDKPKHYTPEKLSEYLDSEIECIQREREDPKNWLKNQTHFSQFFIRSTLEEGQPNGIHAKPSTELQQE